MIRPVALLALMFMLSVPAAAQAPRSADEIVVTAQRSGIPVWRVDGPRSTLILVGTIAEVSEGTSWDPQSLLAALRGADRVMFPASVQYKASIFTLMALQSKGRRMATLPKGQSLSQYVSAADYARIAELATRGAIPADIDRKHPRQIIQELIQYAKGEKPSKGFFSIEKVKPGTDPEGFVRSAVDKYKIALVPLATAKLKPALGDVFSADSTGNEQCLRAAIALAEAGPGAVPARSRAWASRQVPAVLASVAQHAIDECRPATMAPALTPEIRRTVRSLLDDPKTTVAVFDLPLLARPGGLLDELSAAGFRVRGPAWK